ncbi:hypothetical protein UPYG_G00146770 [Umbra pygmaea]|uniref:Ig-like domain-containing protein n=1 Tax=Umbra pygmaea TaxID=75934 RepID=A0ABD0WWW8_UMBPY
MNLRLPLVVLCLTVLLSVAVSQSPIPIQFNPDAVLVQTGNNAVFTLVTAPQVYSITWNYPGGVTPLGTWIGGNAVLNTVSQYQNRVSITATQLSISNAQLGDAGNYSAQVAPLSTTDMTINTRSIQLSVFDAVTGVILSVPSLSLEGANVSLSCTWTKGTAVTVQWGKDGAALTSNSRITITGGNLVINPANRGDTGVYRCTVSNLVSAQTATQTLTIYYGPDTPVLSKVSPANCVGGGDIMAGQALQLTCTSSSLPSATISWQYNGVPVMSGNTFTLQTFSTNQSGQYTCIARNAVTGNTSQTGTNISVVGTCLSPGAVAGIVVGCIFALILIIVVIVLCLCWRRIKQWRNEAPGQKTPPPHARLVPPVQRPDPPLHTQPTNLYNALIDGNNNANTLHHNGHANTNGFSHNTQHHNANSLSDNGTRMHDHNDTFTHTQNTNTLRTNPQMTQHNSNNPNILIQAGTTQVGVNLNTQQNNRTQQPTVHVNLNSYPANGQQLNEQLEQQFTNPQDGATNNVVSSAIAPQVQNTNQPTSRVPFLGGPSRVDRSHLDTGFQVPDALIATGYTHSRPSFTDQPNANTQSGHAADRQPRQSNRTLAISGQHGTIHSSPDTGSQHQQIPWDRLRGTPAYPNESPRRLQGSPENMYTSDSPESPAQNRLSQAHTQRGGPRAQNPPQGDSVTRNSAALQPGAHISRHALSDQRAQEDVIAQSHITAQAAAQSQTSPRQQSASRSLHNSQPQSKGPNAPNGLLTNQPRGSTLDTRALADPNHFLPQAQAKVPQGSREVLGEPEPDRRGTAAQMQPVKQNASGLTQKALERHTLTTHNPFQNRNHQTQAALLKSQALGPKPGHKRPPSPPPVIPLAQFQTLPRERSQHPGTTRPANAHQHQGNGHQMQPVNTRRPGQHGHRLPAHPHQPNHHGRPRH